MTVKNLQSGLFFIDAAVVMWALEPQAMTIYINIYTYRYTSMAVQSAVRQINIIYIPMAYVPHILTCRNTCSDYLAYKNIIPTSS